jgi:hypothetical protein
VIDARRRISVTATRCERGHVHAHPQHDSSCDACGARTRATRVLADATLVLVTTVRVNPFGAPFRLGLAVTKCGRARVLCRIEGAVRGSGHDRVRLEARAGVFYAVAVRGRGLTGRSRA